MFITLPGDHAVNTDHITDIYYDVQVKKEHVTCYLTKRESVELIVRASVSIVFDQVLTHTTNLTGWQQVMMETDATSLKQTYLKHMRLSVNKSFNIELVPTGRLKINYPRNMVKRVIPSWNTGSISGVDEYNLINDTMGGSLWEVLTIIKAFKDTGLIKYAFPTELDFYGG